MGRLSISYSATEQALKHCDLSDLNLKERFEAAAPEVRRKAIDIAARPILMGLQTVYDMKVRRFGGDDTLLESTAPPVFPICFAQLAPGAFGQLVDNELGIFAQDRGRQETKEELFGEFTRLKDSITLGQLIVADLRKHATATASFNHVWASAAMPLPSLKALAAGLATVRPHSASIERLFSSVRKVRTSLRTSLQQLSMAGAMHSAQFNRLQTLVEKVRIVAVVGS
eukprot:GHVU01223861.1.p1 GENE.GHVU01223861.1~~GHVU01223861.1.p1  ORF type:complete len:227 (+),score=28.87 GHVU01223861.1:703-1383(+)